MIKRNQLFLHNCTVDPTRIVLRVVYRTATMSSHYTAPVTRAMTLTRYYIYHDILLRKLCSFLAPTETICHVAVVRKRTCAVKNSLSLVLRRKIASSV